MKKKRGPSRWGNITPIERFWSRVNKNGPVHPKLKTKCWVWLGALTRNSGGYGQIEIEGKSWQAHRASWMFRYGKIPDGMLVCHKCDNPACIRPSHLFLGTHLDNGRDKARKDRVKKKPGEKNPSVKITREEAVEIKRLYATGDYFQRELAEKFGISRTQVGRIVRNESWRHVL